MQREESVRRCIPELFGSEYNSVLYVGANQKRQHFLKDFYESKYEKITVLEAFDGNFEFLKKTFPDSPYEIVHGDVRKVDELIKDGFDVVFFWHGIEHLYQEEIAAVLKKLEHVARRIVVLGMPYGRYVQGAEYGNPYEEHLSAITPDLLKGWGYECETLMKKDERGSNITAWKYV